MSGTASQFPQKQLWQHFPISWPCLSTECIPAFTPWGVWERHKGKVTVSVFMPSPTLWQTLLLLSSRRFPFASWTGRLPPPTSSISTRMAETDAGRYLDIYKNKATCQTSRGPQSRGADSEAICEEVAPGRGCVRSKQRRRPANKLKWKASSGAVWEKFNPCKLLYALKAPECGVCLSFFTTWKPAEESDSIRSRPFMKKNLLHIIKLGKSVTWLD